MNILEYLAKEVERTGHKIKYGESSFMVEPLNLQVEAELGERNEHNVNGEFSVVIQITIKATHDTLFPEGIWDCLAGIGRNDDEAFSYASQIWTTGIFLTIHEVLVSTETKDFQVPRFDMITRNQETGEDFAWKLYLGAFQPAGEFSERTDLDETILVKKLLSEISSITVEKRLYWIKIYIAKLSKTGIQGDCWLNNQDWLDGLNTLYWFAEEWKDVKLYAAMKQFIIVKPCEISEIENAEKIRESLPPIEKRNFLSRWFK